MWMEEDYRACIQYHYDILTDLSLSLSLCISLWLVVSVCVRVCLSVILSLCLTHMHTRTHISYALKDQLDTDQTTDSWLGTLKATVLLLGDEIQVPQIKLDLTSWKPFRSWQSGLKWTDGIGAVFLQDPVMETEAGATEHSCHQTSPRAYPSWPLSIWPEGKAIDSWECCLSS